MSGQSGSKPRPDSKGGALSQMVAAGSLLQNQQNLNEEAKGMRIENEQLKAMIEIMKVEMESILKSVSGMPAKPAAGPGLGDSDP